MTYARNQLRARCALITLLVACNQPSASAPTEPEAPSLATEVAACEAGDAPVTRARQALESATARAERYPFAPQEGPRALRLLAEARACFERAGDAAGADTAARKQTALFARLDGDYRALRIRLSRARAAKRDEQAVRATRQLLALLHDQQGAYVNHLRTLEHALRRRSASKEKS